jgi:hypothetical protein
MKGGLRTISIEEMADRRNHLRDALGNAALEGIKPQPQAMADLQKVIGGTLSTEQYSWNSGHCPSGRIRRRNVDYSAFRDFRKSTVHFV